MNSERKALVFLLSLAGLCMGVALGLTPRHAAANDKFSIENLSPAPSQRTSIISVYGTETLKLGEWELNALVSYAPKPLSAEQRDGTRIGDLVGSIGSLNLMGTVGLTDWLDLSLAMPLHRTTEGYALRDPVGSRLTLNDLDGDEHEVVVSAGDLRIVPRAQIYQSGGLGIGIVGSLFLPTGKKDSYMGEKLRFEPRLAVDYKVGDLRLAGNVGYMWRKENRLIPNNQVDDAFTWGAGLDAPIVSVLHAIAEVDGWLGVASDKITTSQAPMEWRVGPRIVSGGWLAQLGGGTALVRGIGAPTFRLYASVGYSGVNVDQDGDGILDGQDGCPEVAEDKDGFKDEDGCPESDNDGDGVPDATDGAPLDPEDKDGFADEDGVPEGDNDNDGVLDAQDGAPLDPEDKDGFEDENGIPDADNDRDGVRDSDDKCPMIPGLPEDKGCAAMDSDIDGTIDRDDKCPRDAGPAKNQGCPLVQVTASKLEIGEKVFFDNNSDVIQERSFALLNAVARSLAEHPEVQEVTVTGHTDTKGMPAKNLELSKRRAASVVKYLIGKGTEPWRLKSLGLGQTKPIAPNDTDEGRGENRRVEFSITKRKDAAEAPPKAEPAPAPAAATTPKAPAAAEPAKPAKTEKPAAQPATPAPAKP